MNILGKRSDLPFSRQRDRKKEKSTVSLTHVQNIICSQTQLDGIAHEHTIICKQLFEETFASNDNTFCCLLLRGERRVWDTMCIAVSCNPFFNCLHCFPLKLLTG